VKLPGIPKDPGLPPVLDFDRLRREGIAHIEALGASLWTDYNTHDPGITILEALCFAINDLGYRCSLPIGDLLAPEPGTQGDPLALKPGTPDDLLDPGPGAPVDPEGRAPLFSAREILTCYPVTRLDYRKLLLDVEGVRNAWILDATAPCLPFYPHRQESKLGYEPPVLEPDTRAVLPRGVSSVVLELDDDPLLGSLNDTTWPWQPRPPGEPASPLPLEIVLPQWGAWRDEQLLQQPILEWHDAWLSQATPTSIQVIHDLLLDAQTLEAQVRVEVAAARGSSVSRLIPLRVKLTTSSRGDIASWRELILAELKRPGHDNPLHTYRQRLRKAFTVAHRVIRKLQSHRGLCEDFQEPKAALFEEISLCADVELEPGADIEAVQARILVAAARLLAPPVRFHTLAELLGRGLPVEQIFDGPALHHGFLLDEEVEASEPPEEVFASDFMSEIMKVEGVIGIRSFSMGAHAPDGRGLASDEAWRVHLLPGHLPRLAPDRCKFVFFKRGIPFRADAEEVRHKLAYLAEREGMIELAHPTGMALDLEPPTGTWQALNDYRTIQHDLPRVFGIGPEGLPESADAMRKAQAKQLKAYLLFFDQLLANYVSQLANLRKLFSIDPSQQQTLFSDPLFYRPELEEELKDLFQDSFFANRKKEEVLAAFNALAENAEESIERRNRLLDHLLARFNERFAEYAAVMASLDREKVKADDVVAHKITFLKNYPRLSSERGKGFDTGDMTRIWAADNVSGLERRLCGVLGITVSDRRNLAHCFELSRKESTDGSDAYLFRLRDRKGELLLDSTERYATLAETLAAMMPVDTDASQRERYEIKQDEAGQYLVTLKSLSGKPAAQSGQRFATLKAAEDAIGHILETLKETREREGLHLVEHILLRPMSAQHRLLGVTLDPDCQPCPEDADPYSFRATLVFPAWVQRFTSPAFRAFVEQTARLEAPAHVFLKICWVDPIQMSRFEAAYLPWLEERSRQQVQPEALARCQSELVTVMESLRSIYPTATLHDYQENLVENPVLLGRTQLGTLPNEPQEE
jgi:uncharacterized protein YegP (UPF0339 family)